MSSACENKNHKKNKNPESHICHHSSSPRPDNSSSSSLQSTTTRCHRHRRYASEPLPPSTPSDPLSPHLLTAVAVLHRTRPSTPPPELAVALVRAIATTARFVPVEFAANGSVGQHPATSGGREEAHTERERRGGGVDNGWRPSPRRCHRCHSSSLTSLLLLPERLGRERRG